MVQTSKKNPLFLAIRPNATCVSSRIEKTNRTKHAKIKTQYRTKNGTCQEQTVFPLMWGHECDDTGVHMSQLSDGDAHVQWSPEVTGKCVCVCVWGHRPKPKPEHLPTKDYNDTQWVHSEIWIWCALLKGRREGYFGGCYLRYAMHDMRSRSHYIGVLIYDVQLTLSLSIHKPQNSEGNVPL